MPEMKNKALKVRRPNDLLDKLAASFGQIPKPVLEFAATTVTRPQRMLVMAEMNGIEHSLVAALADSMEKAKKCDVAISLESVATAKYGLALAEGLKIVDDYSTFGEPRVRLSESDDLDEIKDSIFDVLEDELVRTHARLDQVLRGYTIFINHEETEIDPVNQALALKARTDRESLQVNAIMTNMKVRKVIRGNVNIKVTTPECTREFNYQDDRVIYTAPDVWDKGTIYNEGDYVNMPGAPGAQYRAVRSFSSAYLSKFWNETEAGYYGTKTGRFWGRISPA